MSWKILCSLSNYNPDKLVADLAKNQAAAAKSYSHALIVLSPNANVDPVDAAATLKQLSSQACESFAVGTSIKAGPAAGYYEFSSQVAVVIASGADVITAAQATAYNTAFTARLAASTAVKKGFPLDCLGYCVGLVQSATGAQTVAGRTTL